MAIGLVGSADFWIRTDGNDTTGDGSANTAAKAFASIQGAWNRAAGNYAASPLFTVNLKLGIPGTYAGAILGPFGGNLTLTGDPANKANYKITSLISGNTLASLTVGSADITLRGVNLALTDGSTQAGGSYVLRIADCECWIDDCQFTLETSSGSNPAVIFRLENFSTIACLNAIDIVGGGFTITGGVHLYRGDFAGCPPGSSSPWTWSNINFSDSTYVLQNGSFASHGQMTISSSAVGGKKYSVVTNSILYQFGLTIPGNLPGVVGSGGQVF